MNGFSQRPDLSAVRKKAEHYCAYQERCHAEVEQKLYGLGLKGEEVMDVILHLVEKNYLNEERFARAFAGGKFRTKQWGRKKIVYHLKGKGINNQTIQIAMEEIDDNEYEAVLENWLDKKVKTMNQKDSYIIKQKLFRFLSDKGFEADLIQEKLNKRFGK